jgi:hypothetical protein
MRNLYCVGWAQTLGTALSLTTLCGTAWAQAPAASTTEPATSTPAPATSTPAPATSTLAPATSTPAPVAKPTPSNDNPLPTIELGAPPLAPPVTRTLRSHDGFYLRVNAGLGSLLDANVHNPSSLPDLEGGGTSLDIDLMVGGSPSPGMALGGALLLSSIASADYESDTETVEADTDTWMLAPFIDGYPSPRGGFHLGGAVGLAQVRSDKQEVTGYKNATGLGIAAWLGYDAWIGDEWSMGGLVRLLGTRAKGDTDNGSASLNTVNLSVMLTAVYN